MTLVIIVTLTILYAEEGGKNMSGVKKDINEQSGIQDRKDPFIQVRHVSKIYQVEDDDPDRALDDVSNDIYPAEISSILGDSGIACQVSDSDYFLIWQAFILLR